MEIEKKFLVKDMPQNLNNYQKELIEQAYLSLRDPVLRIRKSNDKYMITYKSRIGLESDEEKVALTCKEVELPISKEAYDHLYLKADYHVIYKTRYLIPLNEYLTAELDVFHERLDGLVLIEVEFPDDISASNFTPPSWFGLDVTFDDTYKNNHLVKVDSYRNLT